VKVPVSAALYSLYCLTRQLPTTRCALLRLYKLHYNNLYTALRSTVSGETTANNPLHPSLSSKTVADSLLRSPLSVKTVLQPIFRSARLLCPVSRQPTIHYTLLYLARLQLTLCYALLCLSRLYCKQLSAPLGSTPLWLTKVTQLTMSFILRRID
jgi:hypothetical protein